MGGGGNFRLFLQGDVHVQKPADHVPGRGGLQPIELAGGIDRVYSR